VTHRSSTSLLDRLLTGRKPGSHAPSLRRPRLLPIVVGLILVLALLVGLMAVRDLSRAGSASERAIAAARRTVQLAIDGDTSAAQVSLDSALTDLDAAGSSLDTSWISLVGLFPPIADEIDASTAGIAAARALALAGQELLEFANADRPALLHDGRLDARALALLNEALDSAAINTIEARTALNGVKGSRSAAVRKNLQLFEEASASLFDGLVGTEALVTRLESAVSGGDGPFRTLVLFENGAELRATGGLIGIVAELVVDRGPLRLTNVAPFFALRPPGDGLAGVEAPDDYLARYGVYLANTPLWSNVNLSPHFPTVAGVAGALYEQATGHMPELVVRLDLTGAGQILSALPAEAQDDLAFDPSKLATDFVIDSYLRYEDTDQQNVYLAEVVDEMFLKLLAVPTIDGGMLGGALVRSSRERHLAVFSKDPAVQGLFEAAGVDGALQPGDPGQVEVVVQNFGANKLDLYTETSYKVALEPNDCTMSGTISTTINNAAPPDAVRLPSYNQTVDGLWWVNVYLPTRATVLDILEDGQTTLGSVQKEQDRPVAATLVAIPAGQAATVTVRWREELTGPTYQLALQPQPLVNPATLTVLGFPAQQFNRSAEFDISTECLP